MTALILLGLLFTQDEFRITTDVNQVVLPVTVTDRKGRYGAGLEKDSFTVYENGRPQEIRFFSNKDVPVTVGLVIDNSSSMRPRRSSTNLAAIHFARLSNPEDQVFVVNFSDRVSFGLPDGVPFTGDGDQLRQALASEPPAGKTALYDAVVEAIDHLERGKCDRKALIVISDGGDTASRRTLDDVLRRAHASHALIYTIALVDDNEQDPNRRPKLLKKLAETTGGDFHQPENADALYRACARIARELRSQYTIAYTPDGEGGGFRRVQVVVKAPGKERLSVRTREGYNASEPERAGR
jgi:VWFA-related protein